MKEKRITIRFMGGVEEQSARSLISIVENNFKQGVRFFKIIISSPGGFVDLGLSIFNFLKGLPIDLITVNFGAVDSISAVIFCAGAKRISVPNARFIIHDVMRLTPPQPVSLSEIQLAEWLNSLKIDRNNIAKVIAETCNKPVEDIEAIMKQGKVLDPYEAQKLGLVHEIQREIIKEGEEIISIN